MRAAGQATDPTKGMARFRVIRVSEPPPYEPCPCLYAQCGPELPSESGRAPCANRHAVCSRKLCSVIWQRSKRPDQKGFLDRMALHENKRSRLVAIRHKPAKRSFSTSLSRLRTPNACGTHSRRWIQGDPNRAGRLAGGCLAESS